MWKEIEETMKEKYPPGEMRCRFCGAGKNGEDFFEVNFDAYVKISRTGTPVEYNLYVDRERPVTCIECGSDNIVGIPQVGTDEFEAWCGAIRTGFINNIN